MVTVNDYLARRDAEWVGQPLRFLGMTVGVVQTPGVVLDGECLAPGDIPWFLETMVNGYL